MLLSVSARLPDQFFYDDAVAPDRVELSVTPVDAHLAEVMLAAQGPARGVFRKDARHELPEAAGLACRHQCLQHHASGPEAACVPREPA